MPLIALAAVLSIAAAGVEPAFGAQRFGGPDGSGTACTREAPCDYV